MSISRILKMLIVGLCTVMIIVLSCTIHDTCSYWLYKVHIPHSTTISDINHFMSPLWLVAQTSSRQPSVKKFAQFNSKIMANILNKSWKKPEIRWRLKHGLQETPAFMDHRIPSFPPISEDCPWILYLAFGEICGSQVLKNDRSHSRGEHACIIGKCPIVR